MSAVGMGLGWCDVLVWAYPFVGEGNKPFLVTDWERMMDSETMLGIHMFGDVQTSEKVQECGECGAEFTGAGFPIGSEGCWISNPNCGNCYGHVNGVYVGDDFDAILLAQALLAESRGVYAFNRELSGTDAYADLITLIENHYGDWAYKVLDRYTVQALWSLADEYGAHNALEFIQSQDDSAETL